MVMAEAPDETPDLPMDSRPGPVMTSAEMDYFLFQTPAPNYQPPARVNYQNAAPYGPYRAYNPYDQNWNNQPAMEMEMGINMNMNGGYGMRMDVEYEMAIDGNAGYGMH
jgi:hypothetical protein